MSLFITFEGIEGCGKSTQIKLLNDALKLRGHETLLTREPGGTSISEEIRKILLNEENKKMTSICELFLYSASRSQHLSEIIEPALEAKKIVLCDRFADATMAYQGYARGLSIEQIKKINKIAVGLRKPDITFLLDCDPKIGLTRASERTLSLADNNSGQDRFENEPLEFHQKVREGYLKIAKEEPDRIVVIDASKDVETMHQEILKHVLKML